MRSSTTTPAGNLNEPRCAHQGLAQRTSDGVDNVVYQHKSSTTLGISNKGSTSEVGRHSMRHPRELVRVDHVVDGDDQPITGSEGGHSSREGRMPLIAR